MKKLSFRPMSRLAAGFVALAGAAVFSLTVFADTGYSSDVVASSKFDSDLYDVLLWQYDQDDSGDLSEFELARVTDLDLSEMDMTSLRGISYLPNLARLNAADNKLRNVTSLKNCPNLQILDISGNSISSLKGIGTLENLRQLDASYNKINDLGDIDDCSLLSILDLSGNKVYSVAALEGLENLTSLSLDNNALTGLGSLPKSLTTLSAADNKLSSLSGVNRLTKLTYLDLSDNSITSLDGLVAGSTLKNLYLTGNSVTSLAGLEKLTGCLADLSWNKIPTNADAEKANLAALPSGTKVNMLPQRVRGWQLHAGQWYYFTDEEGTYISGSTLLGGVEYYFDDYGILDGDNTAPVNPIEPDTGSGTTQPGVTPENPSTPTEPTTPSEPGTSSGSGISWVEKDGGKYYLDASGNVIKTGWVSDGENYYWINDDGKMRTGWLFWETSWYYMNKDGIMLTGWQKVDDVQYYFYDWGGMAHHWFKADNVWYYATGGGALQKNAWVQSGGYWYWMKGDGSMMSSGWLEIGGLWYCFDASGIMGANRWVDYGQSKCWLSSSGAMLTGWQDIGGQTYYLSKATGCRVQGQWARIDGKTYYFNNDGHLQRNTTIGGYKVGPDGAWIQ